MKFRKKPIVIEATQWFKNGDHPQDDCEDIVVSAACAKEFPDTKEGDHFKGEGWVVRYYRHPHISGQAVCKQCGMTMHVHGWIDTLEGGHIVCPGDWIITRVNGEYYPCKPDIFEKTYEPVP
jgi:hypothetical protein